ncbi:hypothetical protein [Psychromonas aquimarina]|uniref:hypothetical protein n=1 Tax=Psychromonas aquimarina TaxID=444919 RepID=UPI0003FEC0D5|nr:hypothetical protein [Psychromonas aquimarina]
MKLSGLLMIFFLFSCPLVLTAKETVLWRVTDWPPFYILEGKDKGKGLYDEMITLLSRGMPEYTHVRKEMNTDRVRNEMNKGTKVCHPSVLFNTEGTLSVVNSILLPHRLIFQKNDSRLTKFNDPASLDILFADKEVRGGIIPRRYTAALNKITNKHSFRDHLYKTPHYKKVIKMLLHNRLDYIIEYTPIISYSAKQLGIENNTTSKEILETQDTPFLLVYVACPKTDWGQMMIDKINKILLSESKTSDFLNFRIRWYDNSSKKLLEKYYQEHYFNDK